MIFPCFVTVESDQRLNDFVASSGFATLFSGLKFHNSNSVVCSNFSVFFYAAIFLCSFMQHVFCVLVCSKFSVFWYAVSSLCYGMQ
jgi:hypothetical protein